MRILKQEKVSRSKLAKEADRLFSLKIREDGACRKCGKTTNLQCSHIVSRSYHATRWDLDNAQCLCSGCHIYFTHHPIEFEKFVVSCIGVEAYLDLKKRALNYATKIDYEGIIRRLS